MPTALSGPQFIIKGPDGALWFTELATNKIGRITTTGVITEFPVPRGSSSNLLGITAGPDGALWFAEQNSVPCAIGRIAGYFRYQIVLSSPRAAPLQAVLARVRDKGALARSERIAVDVDPVSLL